jgi:NADPH-dependent 7-cyano-7-deazaguanine reductase QueF
MTQDEYKRLLLGVVDDVNFISYYVDFLKIALEQCNSPNENTLDRIELLLSTFLERAECHFEQLEFSCKDIVKLCNTETVDD